MYRPSRWLVLCAMSGSQDAYPLKHLQKPFRAGTPTNLFLSDKLTLPTSPVPESLTKLLSIKLFLFFFSCQISCKLFIAYVKKKLHIVRQHPCRWYKCLLNVLITGVSSPREVSDKNRKTGNSELYYTRNLYFNHCSCLQHFSAFSDGCSMNEKECIVESKTC